MLARVSELLLHTVVEPVSKSIHEPGQGETDVLDYVECEIVLGGLEKSPDSIERGDHPEDH